MRDADNYDGRAVNCLQAILEDNPAELTAQIDAMTVEERYDLIWHAEKLAKAVRVAWLDRATKPAGGVS